MQRAIKIFKWSQNRWVYAALMTITAMVYFLTIDIELRKNFFARNGADATYAQPYSWSNPDYVGLWVTVFLMAALAFPRKSRRGWARMCLAGGQTVFLSIFLMLPAACVTGYVQRGFKLSNSDLDISLTEGLGMMIFSVAFNLFVAIYGAFMTKGMPYFMAIAVSFLFVEAKPKSPSEAISKQDL